MRNDFCHSIGRQIINAKEALSRVLFLKALSAETIATIVTAGKELILHKGEQLFAEHERCIGLLVVLTGAIKVYKLDSRGRELILGVEGPGSSVAELPLFDGGNYPASAEAIEDSTKLLVVPRERFRQIMAEHPEIAEHAVRALAVRMRRLLAMVEAQSLHSVQVRLASYLLDTAKGNQTFRLEDTNEIIAGSIGTVRDVVSRTLGNLRKTGVIEIRGRGLTILNYEQLVRIAERDE